MKTASLTLFLFLVTLGLMGNKIIKFDRTVEQSEEKWVVCPQLEDGSYQFGFVFDLGEGLTFRLEGAFIINEQGNLERLQGKKINPDAKLNGSSDTVAWLPIQYFATLGIGQFPSWYEKKNPVVNKNVFALYTEGLVHNSKGEYSSAMIPLEQAFIANPDYKNLRLQLAITYNALEMFDKAINLMEKAIPLESKSYALYEQLSYAQIHLKKVKAAEKSAKKGIRLCKINAPRCQMALSVAYHYFDQKNSKKLKKWLREARKYALDGGRQAKQIGKMLEDSYDWPKE